MISDFIFHLVRVLAFSIPILHWVIVIGLGTRIILKRRPPGVSLAWLFVVTSVPFVGAFFYLFVGELWLPRRRIRKYNAFKALLAEQIDHIESDWELNNNTLPHMAKILNAQSDIPLGISALGGNSFEIFSTNADCISKIVEDIDNAKHVVSMLFYIWDSAGSSQLVEDAMIRAVERGVACKLMVDSAGSKEFIRSNSIHRLRRAGIDVIEALPVGMFRVFFARIDVRNHRKIITIDHDVAYTGSMNMVDPKYFHVQKGVGQWVDVMSRIGGPAARVLDMTLNLDWAVETPVAPEEQVPQITAKGPVQSAGDVALHVVPSGPDQAPRIIHDMLLTLIYNTSDRLIITTPYFIPSESMLTALIAASMRGVKVTIVIPQLIDSFLVRHASSAYLDDLFEAGIEVCAYQGGLLHSKTVTADDKVGMLGTVNMDKRSFWINFEISIFGYDERVVNEIRGLQEEYIAGSGRIDPESWRKQPLPTRILQNAIQLTAPIL